MAISGKSLTNQIRFIIEDYGLLLKYMMLGPTGVSKKDIQNLLEKGLLTGKHVLPSFLEAYAQTHFDLLRDKSRQSIRDNAMKHVRERAGMYIDRLIQRQAEESEGIVREQLLLHNRKLQEAVREELPKVVTETKSLNEISRRLRERTKDFNKDWRRVVNTELAEAHNLGALDAVIENNRGKGHDEVYVYKTGPHDAKTCKYCMRFWFMKDGVTPRVYKLSELMANGTNVGRKAADWLPTVGVTHPNDRHVMLEIPVGWTFKDGAISYARPGHKEYEKQQS